MSADADRSKQSLYLLGGFMLGCIALRPPQFPRCQAWALPVLLAGDALAVR